MGVDVPTFQRLVALQHREITPEDYEVLQVLDEKEGLLGGVAPKTLTREALDGLLPHWIVPDALAVEGHASSDCTSCGALSREAQCSICFDLFEGGQTARTLPCGHHFHTACIDPWLTHSSNKCPMDSKPVLSEEAALK